MLRGAWRRDWRFSRRSRRRTGFPGSRTGGWWCRVRVWARTGTWWLTFWRRRAGTGSLPRSGSTLLRGSRCSTRMATPLTWDRCMTSSLNSGLTSASISWGQSRLFTCLFALKNYGNSVSKVSRYMNIRERVTRCLDSKVSRYVKIHTREGRLHMQMGWIWIQTRE